MGLLQNLFLVADADSPHSPAFERTRALALAAGAKVHCAAFPYSRFGGFVEAAAVTRAREANMEVAMRCVEQQARYLREAGIDASSRVIWAEAPLPEVLTEAYRHKAQLLIKDVGRVTGIGRLLTTPLDLELLRRGRLPLMLVGAGARGLPRHLLVAADVLDGPGALNACLLHHAQELARLCEGELHLAYVGAPLAPPHGADAAGVAAAMSLAADVHSQREEALGRIGAAAGLPAARRHLLEGAAAAALREFVLAKGFDLLVLATANKACSDRQLMGRVAEEVVAQAPCSLLCIPVEAVQA